ncbi:homoserine kinase [Selenomonas sp. TAMA-11512]|uniref:homoserine kinase n=1 Tax=Selenomonas sp. TAMA-11512 TaxID=3095337 RepID=UPI00309125F3|nr:homoserine kinase [Selenomonas sp. TAMA-11512]
MQTRTVRVRVPGTSANCGPGFDAIGVACTIYNELELALTSEPSLTIEIEGEGAENIPKDERNIVWKSIVHLLRRAKRAKEYRGAVIHMKNDIPLSRGLGSSAAAIVSGLKAANILLDEPFTRRDLLDMATEIEGHPDNVAPALFGGFTVSVTGKRRVDCFAFQSRLPLKLVVAVPDFPLSTKMARSVLPAEVPMQDAVYNVGRAAMLVAALSKGNPHFLRTAFDDALHQPYREKLIPGMRDVFRAAKSAGAVGATLSGAGPCLIAFTLEHEDKVGAAMVRAFERHDVHAEALQLEIDTTGAEEIIGSSK